MSASQYSDRIGQNEKRTKLLREAEETAQNWSTSTFARYERSRWHTSFSTSSTTSTDRCWGCRFRFAATSWAAIGRRRWTCEFCPRDPFGTFELRILNCFGFRYSGFEFDAAGGSTKQRVGLCSTLFGNRVQVCVGLSCLCGRSRWDL